jgi:hypothetical protein
MGLVKEGGVTIHKTPKKNKQKKAKIKRNKEEKFIEREEGMILNEEDTDMEEDLGELGFSVETDDNETP